MFSFLIITVLPLFGVNAVFSQAASRQRLHTGEHAMIGPAMNEASIDHGNGPIDQWLRDILLPYPHYWHRA